MRNRVVSAVLVALVLSAGAALGATPVKKVISEKGQGYAIKVAYPSFAGEKKLDGICLALARRYVASFRKQQTTFAQQGLKPPGRLSLELGYDEVWHGDGLCCLMFKGYQYLGGAHGMPLLESVVFDTGAQKRLALKDLFQPGSQYLKVISSYCCKALLRQDFSDPNWVEQGAAPKAKNFTIFYPSAAGLTVVFSPYQVAPYAVGIPKVTVPYKLLAPMLAYPLGSKATSSN